MAGALDLLPARRVLRRDAGHLGVRDSRHRRRRGRPGPARLQPCSARCSTRPCDRIADAAVFGALAWWFAGARPAEAAAGGLPALPGASARSTSYIKARAEGAGLSCNVGHRRADRTADHRAGRHRPDRPRSMPYVQAIALWLLVAASAVTVGQRLVDGAAGQVPAPVQPPGSRRRARPRRGQHGAFAAGWAAVRALPEPVARPAVRPASPTWPRCRRRRIGARSSRRTCAGSPAGRVRRELDALVRRGMRSYARYWLETFRLPEHGPRRPVRDGTEVIAGEHPGQGARTAAAA